MEESPGPEIVQLFTFEVLHVIREGVPVWTLAGLAEMSAVGCNTVMLSLSVAEPPGPVQVTLYDVGFCVRGPVERLPEVPPAVKPVPTQLVVLVEPHVSVDDCPVTTGFGEAESVAVGVNMLQECGFRAPLLQERPPSGLEAEPPVPVHPPLLQATHEPLT